MNTSTNTEQQRTGVSQLRQPWEATIGNHETERQFTLRLARHTPQIVRQNFKNC